MRPTENLTVRYLSASLAVIMFVAALAGLAAWAVAKSYFIEDQTHFYLVLFVSITLFLADAYCIFTVIVGYRIVPSRINIPILTLLAIASIPALLFISKFYL